MIMVHGRQSLLSALSVLGIEQIAVCLIQEDDLIKEKIRVSNSFFGFFVYS